VRPPPSPTLPELAAVGGWSSLARTGNDLFFSVCRHPSLLPGHPLLPPLPAHGARGTAERARAGWVVYWSYASGSGLDPSL
jgi:hypothetical protein